MLNFRSFGRYLGRKLVSLTGIYMGAPFRQPINNLQAHWPTAAAAFVAVGVENVGNKILSLWGMHMRLIIGHLNS